MGWVGWDLQGFLFIVLILFMHAVSATAICAVAAAAVTLDVPPAASAAIPLVANDVHQRNGQPDGHCAKNQPGSKVHRITPRLAESAGTAG